MMIALALGSPQPLSCLLAGFPVHPQRSGPLVIKPAGPDLPAKLCQEDPIPSGTPRPLLETL